MDEEQSQQKRPLRREEAFVLPPLAKRRQDSDEEDYHEEYDESLGYSSKTKIRLVERAPFGDVGPIEAEAALLREENFKLIQSSAENEEQLEDLYEKLSIADAALADKEAMIQSLEQAHEDLHSQHLEVLSLLEHVSEQRNQASDRAQASQQAAQQATLMLEALKKEMAEERVKLSQGLESDQKEHDEVLERSRDSKDHEKTVLALKEERDKLSQALELAQKRRDEALLEQSQSAEKNEKVLVALKEENDSLSRALKSLQKEHDEALERNRSSQNVILALDDLNKRHNLVPQEEQSGLDYHKLTDVLCKMAKEWPDLIDDLNMMTSDFNDMTDERDEALRALEDKHKALTVALQEKEGALATAELLTQQQDDAFVQVGVCNQSLFETERALESMTTQRDDALNEVQACNHSLLQTERELRKLEEEGRIRDNTLASVQKERDEAVRAQDAMKERYAAELQQARATIQRATVERDAAVECVKEREKELKFSAQREKELQKCSNDAREAWQREKEKVTQDLEEVKAERDEARSAQTLAEQQRDRMFANNAATEHALEEARKHTTELQALKEQEIKDLEEKYTQAKSSWDANTEILFLEWLDIRKPAIREETRKELYNEVRKDVEHEMSLKLGQMSGGSNQELQSELNARDAQLKVAADRIKALENEIAELNAQSSPSTAMVIDPPLSERARGKMRDCGPIPPSTSGHGSDVPGSTRRPGRCSDAALRNETSDILPPLKLKKLVAAGTPLSTRIRWASDSRAQSTVPDPCAPTHDLHLSFGTRSRTPRDSLIRLATRQPTPGPSGVNHTRLIPRAHRLSVAGITIRSPSASPVPPGALPRLRTCQSVAFRGTATPGPPVGLDVDDINSRQRLPSLAPPGTQTSLVSPNVGQFGYPPDSGGCSSSARSPPTQLPGGNPCVSTVNPDANAAGANTLEELGNVMHAFVNEVRHIGQEIAETRKVMATNLDLPRKPERRNVGEFKKQSPSRRRTIARNDFMKVARVEMNAMLGISHDRDISAVAANVMASPEEVKAYLEGNGDPPKLEPMRLYLDYVRSSWNSHVASLFAEYLLAEYPDLDVTDVEIHEYFLRRVDTLRKHLARNLPSYEGETEENICAREERRGDTELRSKRRRARQTRLRDIRMRICANEADAGSEGWERLLSMADQLGTSGHSSDESEDDTCVVHIKPWRSREVTKLLKVIDENRKSMTALGNPRPGSKPHVRSRQRSAPVSQEPAIVSLPINFYDRGWLDTLTEAQLLYLKPSEVFELPTVEET